MNPTDSGASTVASQDAQRIVDALEELIRAVVQDMRGEDIEDLAVVHSAKDALVEILRAEVHQ